MLQGRLREESLSWHTERGMVIYRRRDRDDKWVRHTQLKNFSREYALFKYLLSREGTWVSINKLSDAVYDEPLGADNRKRILSQLGNLRSKLRGSSVYLVSNQEDNNTFYTIIFMNKEKADALKG